MRHPVIRLFLARLRALAAVGRAAIPVIGLTPYIAPFVRHVIRIERREDEGFVIVEAGASVAALLGPESVGRPFSALFAPADRARVEAMLTAAERDRIGCVFGAEARLSRFRACAVEAFVTPEPASPATGRGLAACLVSIGFPAGWDRARLAPLALLSLRFVDLDGLADGRAPQFDVRG